MFMDDLENHKITMTFFGPAAVATKRSCKGRAPRIRCHAVVVSMKENHSCYQVVLGTSSTNGASARRPAEGAISSPGLLRTERIQRQGVLQER